jgi:glycosyltransferase involved in cell wall biosynthesis
MTLRVSVVIPAYNEQATILQVLREVRKQSLDGVAFEVIVVDDGSHDNTVALLEANPALYDKLVRQTSNGGKGAAVLAGLRVAQGEYVLFQDADLEYSPSHYSDLLFPVLNFGAQLVIGSRFLAPQYTRVQLYWHRLGNTFITRLFNVLFNTTFTDILSCYILYRRDLLNPEELVSMGWEQHAEILCRVVPRSPIVYEVPISYQGRTYEEGKKILARHAIPMVLTIIRYRLRRPPPLPAR